ncbi:MAG TPA: prepilin-type N-terminal cleavage/methylation domain-containing protein [Candidatus Jorgensenbacteria bacterium]|nr:prepilin-type N-terminal cleavage/methylation domain-containing protein [Candidatus Jorgensenbacteria bacterium]
MLSLKRKTYKPLPTGRQVKSQKGFTLLEIMIVIGLFALLVGISIPFGLDVYRSYVLISETRNMVSFLRRAETLSFTNTRNDSYGVMVMNDRFVVFRGASFATRDTAFDEEYLRSPLVIVSGIAHIVFAAVTGRPDIMGTTTFSNGVNEQTVFINEHGTLFW